jgi:hypothetical protein
VASKSKRARGVKQRNLAKDFMYWAIAVFIIKLIVIGNVQGGIWPGADHEGYTNGLTALFKDGIFSSKFELNYWPAGYPLIIYLLSIIGKSFVLTTLAVVQSAIYSFAVYFFASNLADCKRCTQKEHFSITPRERTVTSGFNTILVKSSFMFNTTSFTSPTWLSLKLSAPE